VYHTNEETALTPCLKAGASAPLKGENLIIEAYGCYWHSCPTCGIGSGDNRESEEQRLAAIAGYGYRAVILWEHDIRHDPYKALNNAFRQGRATA
jgi:G:T-mismatch repair DNA endonuclease (very short patch repair protein)